MRCSPFLAAEHSDSLKPVAGKEPPLDNISKKGDACSSHQCSLDCLQMHQQTSPKTPRIASEDQGDKPAPKKKPGAMLQSPHLRCHRSWKVWHQRQQMERRFVGIAICRKVVTIQRKTDDAALRCVCA